MTDGQQIIAEMRRFLRTSMNDIADTIATGGCPTWDNYKELTGVIRGLAQAERHLLDLAEKEEDDGLGDNVG